MVLALMPNTAKIMQIDILTRMKSHRYTNNPQDISHTLLWGLITPHAGE
jgi:hypothetical protein